MNEIINNLFDNINDKFIIKEIDKYIDRLLNYYKREVVVINDNQYFILITNTKRIEKLFIIYVVYYYNHLKTDKHNYVGIDFEFNRGKIALMQITFGDYIWITNPLLYDQNSLNIFINLILLNNKIYKIMQGPESLDLPYMYTELFKNNKDNIIKFTKRLIDTRFLCEYYRLSKNELGKCSIYDGMRFFATIDEKEYNNLLQINESMGPVQYIQWDINKMDAFNIKYAYYDVIYLPTYLNDIYKHILKYTRQFSRNYYYILQIIQFVLLERKNIIDIAKHSKEIVDTMNNYFVKIHDNQYKLIEVYDIILYNFKIVDNTDFKNNVNNANVIDTNVIDINFILAVNYIKNTFSFILKHIVYYSISKLSIIYKTKQDILKNPIKINNINIELKKYRFNKIIKLLKLFKHDVYKKLLNIK